MSGVNEYWRIDVHLPLKKRSLQNETLENVIAVVYIGKYDDDDDLIAKFHVERANYVFGIVNGLDEVTV